MARSTVTLKNEGTEAVVFHVTNPNTGVVEDVPVGIGATTTRTYGGFSDGAHSVTISADGKNLLAELHVSAATLHRRSATPRRV